MAVTALAFITIAHGEGMARADVVPQDEVQCEGKTAGAACIAQSRPGTCVLTPRTHYEYGQDQAGLDTNDPRTPVDVQVLVCTPTSDGGVSDGGKAETSDGCSYGGRPLRPFLGTLLLASLAWLILVRWKRSPEQS